jgi:L,D-transpeptidase YcbB
LRQQSGTRNALGAVKIDMPNSYSVYMHDTNQRNLFNDDYRFDSHGCSRVDNVRDLAAWLLKDQPQWNRATIATGQRHDIPMARKIPRHGST